MQVRYITDKIVNVNVHNNRKSCRQVLRYKLRKTMITIYKIKYKILDEHHSKIKLVYSRSSF